jgi:hypothetical protein
MGGPAERLLLTDQNLKNTKTPNLSRRTIIKAFGTGLAIPAIGHAENFPGKKDAVFPLRSCQWRSCGRRLCRMDPARNSSAQIWRGPGSAPESLCLLRNFRRRRHAQGCAERTDLRCGHQWLCSKDQSATMITLSESIRLS